MIDLMSVSAGIVALAASGVVQKAVEVAGEKAVGVLGEKSAESGWGLGAKIVGRVGGFFRDSGDDEVVAALEAVEQEGDFEGEAAQGLVAVLAERLPVKGGLADDLQTWLGVAGNDDVLAPILNAVSVDASSGNRSSATSYGDNSPAVGEVSGVANFNYGSNG